MRTYRLYLESGPKRRKTMVHVLDLLGCIANGPTTGDALQATPEAIQAYLRLLKRHGEDVDPEERFETEIVQHITQGTWLGNGSPYAVFDPDLEPLTPEDLATYIRRFHGLRDEYVAWIERQDDASLDRDPGGGRTGRAILHHVACNPGFYIGAMLGGKGFNRLHTLVERGEVPLAEAFRQAETMVIDLMQNATPEQLSAAEPRASGEVRTLRKAMRHALEHDWEHLRELSRREGGPKL